MCTTQAGNRNDNHRDHFAVLRERLLNIWNRIDRRFHLKAKMDELVALARANPQVAIVIGVTCLVCALPIVGFAIFILFTSLLGLMGFFFVEGKLKLFSSGVCNCINYTTLL